MSNCSQGGTKIPVTVMGVTIGSCSQIDELEGCNQYYDFDPSVRRLEQFKGMCISIEFDSGDVCGYREGDEAPSVTMLGASFLEMLMFPGLVLDEKAMIVAKDGNAYCAVYKDFVNIQESPSGFGKTPDDAIVSLMLHGIRIIEPLHGILESKLRIPLMENDYPKMLARIVRLNPTMTLTELGKKIEKDQAWILKHMDAETFGIIRSRAQRED